MKDHSLPITVEPYEHQKRAYDFVTQLFGLRGEPLTSNGAILAMDMGTGKTITSIAITGALYHDADVRRVLVVAPLSLLGVWKDEFTKFAAYPVDVTVLQGTLAKKKEQLHTQSDPDRLSVVVVNYESAWRMADDLLRYNADLIIADEGHKIKEARTAQSKGLHKLGAKARYRLLLTGTMISNSQIDVFSQFKFVNDSIFGKSFVAFRTKYFYMTGYGLHTPVFRKEMTDEFLQRMHSVAFRVTKAEALDLPPITEETRYVDLERDAQSIYADLSRESYTELGKDAEVSAVNILTRMLRLSQVTGGYLGDDDGNLHRVSSAKLNAFKDIVDSAMAAGKKLVVMARFVAEMDDIVDYLESAHIGYAQVRGGVKDRPEQVRRFQEDDDCRVFVGQIAAAGLGLTLTAADVMVFYSLDYSSANFTQAQARIHRIGARNTCHYIYLVARHTIDQNVIRALRNKLDLAKTLVDDYRRGNNPFLPKGEDTDDTD